MTETFNIYEAKTKLSQLIERALKGEHIVIAKAGKPLVQLTRINKKTEKPERIPGLLKGKYWESDDCWDPMTEEELKEWYGGELPPLAKLPPGTSRPKG